MVCNVEELYKRAISCYDGDMDDKDIIDNLYFVLIRDTENIVSGDTFYSCDVRFLENFPPYYVAKSKEDAIKQFIEDRKYDLRPDEMYPEDSAIYQYYQVNKQNIKKSIIAVKVKDVKNTPSIVFFSPDSMVAKVLSGALSWDDNPQRRLVTQKEWNRLLFAYKEYYTKWESYLLTSYWYKVDNG